MELKSVFWESKMHGKITRYSMATGSGTVINFAKRVFELRAENWRDRKFLPVSGMFVEFRADSNGHITDAKSSEYQEFGPDSLVTEYDFWSTQTDVELNYKELSIRYQQAEEIYKQTDYLNMKNVELTQGVEECVRQYYTPETNTIKFALADVEEIPREDRLNYMAVKRFMTKAIDFLVFCDKNITPDMFAEDLQKLRGLEFCFKELKGRETQKSENIYTDVFLEKQLHFNGAKKAISAIKERMLQLENKVKFSTKEVYRLRSVIERNKKDATLPPKLEKHKDIIAKSEEEIKIFTACKDRLIKATKSFQQNYVADFDNEIRRRREELTDEIRNALNTIATVLDNKIWQAGMGSTSVHSNFFKQQNINSAYCTMTFYWQYLKRLDKMRLSDAEKMGYNFYERYKKAHQKFFLIYTTDPRLEMSLKTQIMSINKDYEVFPVKSDGEFMSHINNYTFERGYIDHSIPHGDPNALIIEVQKSRRNKDAKFVIVNEEQAAQLSRDYRM